MLLSELTQIVSVFRYHVVSREQLMSHARLHRRPAAFVGTSELTLFARQLDR